MKASIEETIVQWSGLISRVLSEDPSEAFGNSHHATPLSGKTKVIYIIDVNKMFQIGEVI